MSRRVSGTWPGRSPLSRPTVETRFQKRSRISTKPTPIRAGRRRQRPDLGRFVTPFRSCRDWIAKPVATVWSPSWSRGCGTGFEPIDMARIDPSLAITAMDLSRASLAHGMRVAEDLGLTQIRFVQGDILKLDPVQGPFDVITSTGVIHHMARPEDGLARLAGVLRPGGVVRLGLYSERARAVVQAAHDLIRQMGWTPVDADIRAFRAHVLALPDGEPLAALKQSADFYSLSGCRDLVFHVQEHRYTPPQLGDLIAGAGLRLVGLEASPQAKAAFAAAFGPADALDLGLWDRVEMRRPDLFAGMYHLWAQKPAV